MHDYANIAFFWYRAIEDMEQMITKVLQYVEDVLVSAVTNLSLRCGKMFTLIVVYAYLYSSPFDCAVLTIIHLTVQAGYIEY